MNRTVFLVARVVFGTLCLGVVAGGCGGESGPVPSASVSVAGGALVASSLDGPGGTHLDVPAGASPVDVTIVLSAPRGRRDGPAGTANVAIPIRLEPAGHMFDKPLELTIPIAPGDLPPGTTVDDVLVLRADQGSNVFVPLPTRRVGNAVVADTEHFSDFIAIVSTTTTNPFGACLDGMCMGGETCSSCPFDCGLCLPAPVLPMVTSTSPPSGAVGVHPRQDLVLNFSEPLDMATVTLQSSTTTACTGSVQISDGNQCYGGALVMNAQGTQAILRATDDLALGANITVTVTPSATNLAGVGFAGGAVLTARVSPTGGFAYTLVRGPMTTGAMGGIAGADLLCDPAGTTRRKAFVISAARVPCVMGNCVGGASPIDWVLRSNTTYVDAAGDLLFTTDATLPIYTGWPMAKVFSTAMQNFHWGGGGDWTVSANDCSGWTNGVGTSVSNVGYEFSSTNGFIMGGMLNCDSNIPLLCVEQPPAALPALH
jgi:hypothetical protein